MQREALAQLKGEPVKVSQTLTEREEGEQAE